MSLHDIIRAKRAKAKKDIERRLAEIMAQPRDIEAEVRCMWRMILGRK